MHHCSWQLVYNFNALNTLWVCRTSWIFSFTLGKTTWPSSSARSRPSAMASYSLFARALFELLCEWVYANKNNKRQLEKVLQRRLRQWRRVTPRHTSYESVACLCCAFLYPPFLLSPPLSVFLRTCKLNLALHAAGAGRAASGGTNFVSH